VLLAMMCLYISQIQTANDWERGRGDEGKGESARGASGRGGERVSRRGSKGQEVS
jgi:hypothetical protein